MDLELYECSHRLLTGRYSVQVRADPSWPILPCSRNPGFQPEKPGANPGWVITNREP
jgi:hypothetical protein